MSNNVTVKTLDGSSYISLFFQFSVLEFRVYMRITVEQLLGYSIHACQPFVWPYQLVPLVYRQRLKLMLRLKCFVISSFVPFSKHEVLKKAFFSEFCW